MDRSTWFFGGIFIVIALACSGVGSVADKPGVADSMDTVASEKTEEAGKLIREDPEGSKAVGRELSQSGTQMGTLSSAHRASFVLKGSSGDVPPLGATGKVLKKIDKKMGSMSFSAWLGIAEVKVMKVKGSSVTLKIEKEMSEITMNGKKTDHFKPGSQLKLEWKK
tara:strand:- start:33 stop:530 length:498 start_codon:yes stop_codon:yes gene_type:complete